MTVLRKFGCAAVLAAAIFNYAPSLASAAEPAHGRFTLTHDVRWENTSVPAGEYAFSYDPDSIAPVLTLTKVSGTPGSFMLLVPAREDSTSVGTNMLVLESSAAGSYVSAMKLPECGMVLHFNVPHAGERQLAKALTASSAGQ